MSKQLKIELPELDVIKTEDEDLTIEDMEKIEELRDEGYTFKELDKAYSRTKGTISRYLKRYLRGEFPEQEQQTDMFDYGKLGALLNAGWNLKNLAIEFRTNEVEIKNRIKEIQRI